MSASRHPYVIQQGDYLQRLAASRGFDADVVWNDPKNAPLREARKGDGNLLLPGDVLYVPEAERRWQPIRIGAGNTFVAPTASVHVSLRFCADGAALKGEPYVVEGADVPAGALDGDGAFQASVSTRVDSFRIRFPKRGEVYCVRVGHLDPADEPSGMRARLGMLGFFGRGPASCPDEDDHLEAGLRLFQEKHGLAVTGDLDDATTQKVVEVFGR